MPHCDEALKTIGRAIADHQKQNDGQNPPTLEHLVESGQINPWLLICPASTNSFGQSSYTYRGQDLYRSVPAKMILAHDKTPCHKGRRNILFADGSVTRPSEPDFQKTLTRDDTQRKIRGLPQIPSP